MPPWSTIIEPSIKELYFHHHLTIKKYNFSIMAYHHQLHVSSTHQPPRPWCRNQYCRCLWCRWHSRFLVHRSPLRRWNFLPAFSMVNQLVLSEVPLLMVPFWHCPEPKSLSTKPTRTLGLPRTQITAARPHVRRYFSTTAMARDTNNDIYIYNWYSDVGETQYWTVINTIPDRNEYWNENDYVGDNRNRTQ